METSYLCIMKRGEKHHPTMVQNIKKHTIMEYYIKDIEFKYADREVWVYLSNGGCVKICECQESWEQYNGTIDELRVTVGIAGIVNLWLHGDTVEPWNELEDEQETISRAWARDHKESFINGMNEQVYGQGGYILIPTEKRPEVTFRDECEDRTIKVKSIVSVCEYDSMDDTMICLKMIDSEDIMWDVEDYIDTAEDMETLLQCVEEIVKK